MSDPIQAYKNLQTPMPEKILTWPLYGAGLENFGKDKKPVEVPMPECGPDELLARIDAVGICFSDIKVINLGNDHPRVKGRDLAAHPVTLGHEPAITIVGVGENRKDKYKVGQRFIVQADVFYKGTSMAFGYVLAGAQSQYQVITKEVLDGDEGSYLIPLADSTGYAEGAMTEAWACVVASYRISYRSNLKPGGSLWIVAGDGDTGNYTLGMEITSKKVIATGVTGPALDELKAASAKSGFELIETPAFSKLDLAAFEAENGLFNDIITLGANADMVEKVATLLAPEGVINFVSSAPLERRVKVDVGKIHYQNHAYFGTPGNVIADGYKPTRKQSELLEGGTAWFIGGGGPMGKMHVQLALEMDKGPSKVLVTDVGAERLQSVRERFEPIAKSKGIEFVACNPNDMSKEDFEKLVNEFTGGKKFDDIVVLAPVAVLIAGAVPFLAKGGMLNIFAGVPIGTISEMDLSNVYLNGIRFVGSSGSKLSDMTDTLKAAESGQLSTCTAVAAIGGMDASWDGMLAVKELKFTGKTVIFPNIRGLELLSLDDLKTRLPNVYAKLTNGEFWNNEAEEELFNTMLKP